MKTFWVYGKYIATMYMYTQQIEEMTKQHDVEH